MLFDLPVFSARIYVNGYLDILVAKTDIFDAIKNLGVLFDGLVFQQYGSIVSSVPVRNKWGGRTIDVELFVSDGFD